jgi:N utilization substance protein A
MSKTDGVDPIGSCVGQKGARINAIMNELRFGSMEEKIDIILWDQDPAVFVANALSPAKVLQVEVVDAVNKQARVTVPDDQFSLAIGKEGQNVRLAAKLTGWNIDIEGETIKMERKETAQPSTKAAKETKATKEAKAETAVEAKAEVKKEAKPKKVATKPAKVAKVKETKVAKTEKKPAAKAVAPKVDAKKPTKAATKKVVKKPITKKAK